MVLFSGAICAAGFACLGEFSAIARDQPSPSKDGWHEVLSARIPVAEGETRDDRAPHQKEQFGTTFQGELAPAEAPTYVAIREVVAVREGPGTRWPSRFSLSQGKEVSALGMFIEQSAGALQAAAHGRRWTEYDGKWVKIRTDDGNEGFISLNDLLPPEQFGERNRLIAGQAKLRACFDRAKKATGPLASFSGVYSPGICFPPVSIGDLDLQIAMSGRSLLWSEQDKFFSVWNVLWPEKLADYTIVPDSTVTLATVGPVQIYKMVPVSRPNMPTEYNGFKSDKMYYKKESGKYGYFSKCDSMEEAKILEDYYPRAIELFPRSHSKKN
jgi:hypothetical protein